MTTESTPTPAQDSVKQSFKAIEQWGASTNAVMLSLEDSATARAKQLDAMTAVGASAGVLHGMTVTLKDNIDLAGHVTTGGSRILIDNVAQEDAPVTSKLKNNGAIIVAKVHLHEWVFGPTSQSEQFGPCKNPWNLDHVPGGSSGGSGVAVVTGMSVGSIGSDTGGSVRIPAAFNGITGLRPTVGRISNRGSVAVSAAYDTLGPMARTAFDVARMFSVIAGYDEKDPISVDVPVPNVLAQITEPIKGRRIGVMRRWFFDDIDPEIRAAIDVALGVFKDLGADIVDIDLGDVEKSQSLLAFNVMLADAYELHRERIEKQPEKYGKDVLNRMKIGATVSGVDYAAAMRWKEDFHRRARSVFKDVDAIFTPTTPFAAPTTRYPDFLEIIRQISRYTYLWAFAQTPALAVPCGFSSKGMSLSMQFAGKWFDEGTLLQLAHAYQGVTDFHLRHPKPQ